MSIRTDHRPETGRVQQHGATGDAEVVVIPLPPFTLPYVEFITMTFIPPRHHDPPPACPCPEITPLPNSNQDFERQQITRNTPGRLGMRNWLGILGLVVGTGSVVAAKDAPVELEQH